MSNEELTILYTNLATWLQNLAIESNKLSGGSPEFRGEFLDQLVDCRSFLCKALALEEGKRRREMLQVVVEATTNHVVQLERLGRSMYDMISYLLRLTCQ